MSFDRFIADCVSDCIEGPSLSDVHDCEADNHFDHCIDNGYCRYSEHARQLRRYYASGCDPAEAPE